MVVIKGKEIEKFAEMLETKSQPIKVEKQSVLLSLGALTK